MPHTCLIVNADDFGLTRSIDRGIIESTDHGIVNSVSLTVNGNDFATACSYLYEHPELSVGWHINLTSGTPAGKDRLPGMFRGRNALMCALLARRIDPRVLLNELAAQWQRIQETGLPVTHIDSHHDVHCWPVLRKTIMDFARTTNIPFVRFSGAQMYPKPVGEKWTAKPGHALTRQAVKRFSVRCARDVDFIQFRELYQQQDKLIAVHYYIEQAQPGVTLLICHPGYSDPENPLKLSYNHQRSLETEALCDASITELLHRRNIKPVNYKDLADGIA